MSGNHSYDAVRQLAYQLWEQRGGSGGSPEDDWYQAEQMLSGGQEYGDTPQLQQASLTQVPTERVDDAVAESFPASDPPAVHVNDEPPINAGDKWKAVNEAKTTEAATEQPSRPPEGKGRQGRSNRRGVSP